MPFNETPWSQREPRAFESEVETQAAFSDPRYATDPGYRDFVHRCVHVGAPGVGNNYDGSGKTSRVVFSHDEVMRHQEVMQLTEAVKRGEEQYAQMLRDTGHSESYIATELENSRRASADHATRQAEYEKSPFRGLLILDSTPTAPRGPNAVPFANIKEQTAALSSPLYRDSGPSGEAFRAEVAARIAVTDLPNVKVSGTLGPTHEGRAGEP